MKEHYGTYNPTGPMKVNYEIVKYKDGTEHLRIVGHEGIPFGCGEIDKIDSELKGEE